MGVSCAKTLLGGKGRRTYSEDGPCKIILRFSLRRQYIQRHAQPLTSAINSAKWYIPNTHYHISFPVPTVLCPIELIKTFFYSNPVPLLPKLGLPPLTLPLCILGPPPPCIISKSTGVPAPSAKPYASAPCPENTPSSPRLCCGGGSTLNGTK